jgi:hypothetical protein
MMLFDLPVVFERGVASRATYASVFYSVRDFRVRGTERASTHPALRHRMVCAIEGNASFAFARRTEDKSEANRAPEVQVFGFET